MHQSNGFTMILGGVDRSAEFRRKHDTGHRSTVALLVVIALLMAITGWLASLVFTPSHSATGVSAAATPASDASHTTLPADQVISGGSADIHRREVFEQRRQHFVAKNAIAPPEEMSRGIAVVAPK